MSQSEHLSLHNRKAYCKRGHPLSGDNLYYQPSRPNVGQCRACMKWHNDRRDRRRG